MKYQQKVKKRRSFLIITILFLTTFLTFKIFKKVNFQNVSISGSELFSIEDIIANSALDFPTRLIFIKTKYIEKDLKKNLSLENISVYRQIFPFGLKIRIKTRIPIAYGERIFKGGKITGFIDKDGIFIDEKYTDKKNLKKLSTKVFGWKKNYSKNLSNILNFQKNNEVEFVTVNYSQNGYLKLEEKVLKTILLGFNPKIIETQLQIIIDIKEQIKGKNILEKIDNIDLSDPSNPKIKVFKP